MLDLKFLNEMSDYLLKELFPICRSITGNGFRQSIEILRKLNPEFVCKEYPSGKQVFDWTIPKEWNVRDAYIKDKNGIKIVDFKKNNVHLMSYSTPIQKKIQFSELKEHLYFLEKLPEAIPYRTSYYQENWGFCLSYNDFLTLDQNAEYEVFIDSTLEEGSLTIADAVLKGEKEEEILISTYLCHPSLANDNLSGPILTTLLFNLLKRRKLNYTYRFVILPETIGAITYLFENKEDFKQVKRGFVITTVGGPGQFGYKETLLSNDLIDRVVDLTFKELGIDYIRYPFIPDGSDERQYSSPGFRIPVGSITKDKYYEYDYYHTSLDNLDFVKANFIIETLQLYLSVINKIEKNKMYLNLNPYCELQLGKRGLYPQTGGALNQKVAVLEQINSNSFVQEKVFEVSYKNELDSLLSFLFYSDGNMDLLTISEKTKIPIEQLDEIAKKLLENNLVNEV